MQVQEIKASIASMSEAELAEVEAYIRELMADRSKIESEPKPNIPFEDAASHVRKDHSQLLKKLSQ